MICKKNQVWRFHFQIVSVLGILLVVTLPPIQGGPVSDTLRRNGAAHDSRNEPNGAAIFLKILNLKDLQGRPIEPELANSGMVLIDIWATWCVNCRDWHPLLNRLHDKYGDRDPGLRVIGINIDKKNRLRRYFKKYPIKYPVLLDPENQIGKELGAHSLPALFLFDGKGKLLKTWRGGSNEEREAMVAYIEKRMKN